ncbi:hypothetical protein J7295_01898 [Nakaseomyces glabratus]|nr:hypothetical protein J7298_01891 [Nakaseomyces glabratus]KAH7602383.1 hypothetical protein J7295_01898 [Nakaseomyces glabratus]KAH7613773.1 hypothetical protein J7292_01873 [Nakaseomyces glabratus]KAI8397811.1 hypothetical protein J6895_01906 [Nakaseomyces glabratus]
MLSQLQRHEIKIKKKGFHFFREVKGETEITSVDKSLHAQYHKQNPILVYIIFNPWELKAAPATQEWRHFAEFVPYTLSLDSENHIYLTIRA